MHNIKSDFKELNGVPYQMHVFREMQFVSLCYTVVSCQPILRHSVYKKLAVYLSGARVRFFEEIRDLGSPTSGNYTCFNIHGQSVIDYTLASDEILRQILSFKVSPFNPLLSDTHCKISFRILASYTNLPKVDTLKHMPKQYVWGKGSNEKFCKCFTESCITQKLLQFNNLCTNNESLDIHECCSKFENIILSVADRYLLKPKGRPTSKLKNKQKWFDSDLLTMRYRLINKGKLMSLFPLDPIIKGSYFKLYREYNKTRKYKKRTFKQSILNQLDDLQSSDPKA